MSDLYKDVYGQDTKLLGASGWIQWKGTDVCIDLRCPCGADGHIDGMFFYYYECGKCGKKYAVGQTVKLIELTSKQVEEITTTAGRNPFKIDADTREGG